MNESWNRIASLATIGLLLGAFLAGLAPASAAAPVRLVAFGDDGVTSNTQRNVDGAIADGAQGYLGLGDYYYWSPPADWVRMMKPLLDRGAYLAIGNHDDRNAIPTYFASGTSWGKSVNGARIVAIDSMRRMDPGTAQHTQVRDLLCNAPEQTRIVIVHHNWWLGSAARHPGTEFPASASAMDQLVKDCGVDLVLAGHEHNYQRLVRNGVPYVIVGTGGQGIYPVAGSPAGTAATYAGFGRLVLDVSSDGVSAQFRALDGSVRDTFTVGSGASAPAPAPAPAPSTSSSAAFTPRTGNEWWVQVKVAGSPRAVDARDTDGAWTPLTLRSWGDWAGSFRVESGHQVQYRATFGDGSVAESCWYAHPSGGCVTAAPTAPAPSPAPATGAFAATFANVRGNEWWVEADASASGAALAGVEARVNGGAWTALSKTSWGSWAKSLRAPTGSTVELRARSSEGTYSAPATFAWPPR